MSIKTVTLLDAILAANLDDTAIFWMDDKNAHTRKATVAQVRTQLNSAHQLAGTDAVYDIGAVAASRFRDLFLSRDITIGRNLTVNGTISGVTTITATTVTATNLGGTLSTATQNSVTTMTALVSVGALASGSIAAGFGAACFGGNVIANVDATYDVGASGATRFRDMFLSRNLVVGGTITGVTTLTATTLAGTLSTATQNNVTTMTALTSVGALASGSIASGFGGARFAGNVIADTDATYDFGASGATRFRDLFISRNMVIGGTLSGVTTLTCTTVTATNLGGTLSTATQNSVTTMTGLTTVGALASGSIAAGFGAARFGGNVIANVDATYDLGASGATRFRDLFLSRNAVLGGSANAAGFYTSEPGSVSCSNNVDTTVYTLPSAGAYIVACDVASSGVTSLMAASLFIHDGTNVYRAASWSNTNMEVKGTSATIQVNQNGFGTQSVRTRVIRIGS